MTKRGLTILIVAVLVVGLASIAIAGSVGGDSDGEATHVMPGGEVMEGSTMETDTESSPTHTMEGGEVMEGSAMPSDEDSGMGGGSMGGTDMGE